MYDYDCGIDPVYSTGASYGYGNYDSDYDLDIDNGTYSGYGTGSVFGTGFAGMPMMDGTGGYNMEDIYNNLQKQQEYQNDYMVRQQKMTRNADLQVNAPMEAIKGTASALKDKITSNEQDQIQEAYDRYVAAVAAAYGTTPDDSVVKARANSLYASMNNGVTLVQDLRQYGHGSATQGFIQALTFGTYSRHSSEDNVSYITGSPVGTGEKTMHNIGRAAGAATIGGIAGGLAKVLKSSKAGKIGLIAAGISAAITFLTGKVTT